MFAYAFTCLFLAAALNGTSPVGTVVCLIGFIIFLRL